MEPIQNVFVSAGQSTLPSGALHDVLCKVAVGKSGNLQPETVERVWGIFVKEHSISATDAVDVGAFLTWLHSDRNDKPAITGPQATPGSDLNDSQLSKDVVQQLAHRSLSLQSIVAFMRRVLQVMPHYSHRKTRTVDVVWQVVLPETREQCCSYAELAESGVRQLPDKMVSHNWENLFTHLMAAIFADALGQSTYWEVAALLEEPTGLDLIEAKLLDAGVLQSTRWLCMFCVNQHASICDSPGSGCDSVTGAPYKPWEKMLSGAPSEIDKFDSLLQLFEDMQDSYSHLLVVDKQMSVLNRLWVLAEMAEVHRQHLPCSAVLYRVEAGQIEKQAGELDVSLAQATRTEDVEMLLNKMVDKDEVNWRARTEILNIFYQAITEGELAVRKVAKEFVDSEEASAEDNMRKVRSSLFKAQTLAEVQVAWSKAPESLKEDAEADASSAAIYEEARFRAARCCQPWLFKAALGCGARSGETVPDSEESLLERMWLQRMSLRGQTVSFLHGKKEVQTLVGSRVPCLTACVSKGPNNENLVDVVKAVSKAIYQMEADEDYDVLDIGDSEKPNGKGSFGAALLSLSHPDDALLEPELTLYRGLGDEAPLQYEGDWAPPDIVNFIMDAALPEVGILHEATRAWYRRKATGGLLVLWIGSDPLLGLGGSEETNGFLTQMLPVLREVAKEHPSIPCCLLHSSALSSYALKRFIGPLDDEQILSTALEGGSLIGGDKSNAVAQACQGWSETQAKIQPGLMLFLGDLSSSNGVRRTSKRWQRQSHEPDTVSGLSKRLSLPFGDSPPTVDSIRSFLQAAKAGEIAADAFHADQLLLADRFILPQKWQGAIDSSS